MVTKNYENQNYSIVFKKIQSKQVTKLFFKMQSSEIFVIILSDYNH